MWASNILEFLLVTQKFSDTYEAVTSIACADIRSQQPHVRKLTLCRPLIFWSFSNGGCWVFEHFVPLLAHEKRQVVVQHMLSNKSVPVVQRLTHTVWHVTGMSQSRMRYQGLYLTVDHVS